VVSDSPSCSTARSTSSGIGGTIVLSRSGRFSVIVATASAVLYSSVSYDIEASSGSTGGVAESLGMR